MIKVNSLHLSHDTGRKEKTEIFKDISFQLKKGESLAIIGPSGCGKTSLLYTISGLIRPTYGTVSINGNKVLKPGGNQALILQNIGLLPWKTVWNNTVLNLDIDEKNRDRIKGILSSLGLEGLARRYPTQLSEGQKKRVGLARALARNPSILLMDEPLASLDALTKENIQNLTLKLWKEEELTMILVTHDIDEAAFLGQRIMVLSERPARVKAMVENPEMGNISYRKNEEFYQQVQKLRELL
jgi:NitT/TauT family transport system ATP-binding protein